MRLNEERVLTRCNCEEHNENGSDDYTQRQKVSSLIRLGSNVAFFHVSSLIQSSSTLGRPWGGIKSDVEQVFNSFT